MRKLGYIFLSILLSACAATTPAPSATPKTTDTVAPKASSTPTVAVTVTVPVRTETPKPAGINLTEEANNLQAAKIAKFSANCKYFNNDGISFSPNENWLAIGCGYERNQTLEIVSRNGNRWVLQFKNYLPKEDVVNDETPRGGLFPAHWSNDSEYLYFTSYRSYDSGGPCLYTDREYNGLFRVNLSSGAVSTVIPTATSFLGYSIVFSPTGRRLVYQGLKDPIILDLQTGDKLLVKTDNDANVSIGNLTWSPDGLELAYATCEPDEQQNLFPVKKSSIKIFSIQQSISRTVFEIEKNMLFIKSWDVINILKIAQGEYYYDEEIQSFDLNLTAILTPQP